MRSLPDFMIIGMPRCGTSSLYDTLSSHPRVVPAIRKEIRYFDRNHQKGLPWYRGHFPLALTKGDRLTGDGSPSYLPTRGVEMGVQRELPESVRFIVLLRDPVERAHSQWRMMTHRGAETLPFREAVAEEDAAVAEMLGISHRRSEERASSLGLRTIDTGLYVEHLERWFELFSRDRFLVLRSEDFFVDPIGALERVYDHLHLDPPTQDSNVHSYQSTGPDMEADVEQALIERFRLPNKRLTRLLGDTFDWSDQPRRGAWA